MLLLEEFEQAGCHVVFLDRPMSQDPHDQLLLQIRGAVAEYERVLITERMRRGRLHRLHRLQRLQAGVLLPWSVPPYGYRWGIDGESSALVTPLASGSSPAKACSSKPSLRAT
jgi:site-specific DNA recombinase